MTKMCTNDLKLNFIHVEQKILVAVFLFMDIWSNSEKDQMIFEQENQGKNASCYKKVFFILPFTKKVKDFKTLPRAKGLVTFNSYHYTVYCQNRF